MHILLLFQQIYNMLCDNIQNTSFKFLVNLLHIMLYKII